MAFTFDGVNKIISCTSGTLSLDVRDLYSRWKDWAQLNPKYLQAFSVVGGQPVDESNGVYVSSYFFLENDWKVRPQEANHNLRVFNGILLSADGTSPFVQTLGSYNVMIVLSQPIKSETIATGGGGGGDGLTTEEHDQLMSLPDLDDITGAIGSGEGLTEEEHDHLMALSSSAVEFAQPVEVLIEQDIDFVIEVEDIELDIIIEAEDIISAVEDTDTIIEMEDFIEFDIEI
jgi:hypothetical protein